MRGVCYKGCFPKKAQWILQSYSRLSCIPYWETWLGTFVLALASGRSSNKLPTIQHPINPERQIQEQSSLHTNPIPKRLQTSAFRARFRGFGPLSCFGVQGSLKIPQKSRAAWSSGGSYGSRPMRPRRTLGALPASSFDRSTGAGIR